MMSNERSTMALAALAASDPGGALDALIEWFLDEEYGPARPAKAALETWPDPATSTRLAMAVRAWLPAHSIAVAHALEVLGRRRDPAALATILEVARTSAPKCENRPVVHGAAVYALGAFSTSEALDATRATLRLALTSTEALDAVMQATRGLAELARPEVAFELLSECAAPGGPDELRARALFVIANASKEGRAVDLAWSDVAFCAVRTNHAGIKASSIALLAAIPHAEQVLRIAELASEGPLPSVLLEALGRSRDPRALPLLTAVLDEPPPPFATRESRRGVTAASALSYFDDPVLTARAAAYVVDQLALATATWERGAAATQHACAALEKLGDRSVLAAVQAIATEVELRTARGKNHAETKRGMTRALTSVLQALDAPSTTKSTRGA